MIGIGLMELICIVAVPAAVIAALVIAGRPRRSASGSTSSPPLPTLGHVQLECPHCGQQTHASTGRCVQCGQEL